ncbi:Hypothetical predicted protein, partial [Marmota monax]
MFTGLSPWRPPEKRTPPEASEREPEHYTLSAPPADAIFQFPGIWTLMRTHCLPLSYLHVFTNQ